MIEVGVICTTALVLGWLGRGAHDMRLRLEGECMRLAADTKAAEREPAAWDAYRERVHAVERRLERVEKALEASNTAAALARRRYK